MVRLISALVLVLLIVTPTLGQESLVGTYKLVSLDSWARNFFSSADSSS
jgi:hypothetical protein